MISVVGIGSQLWDIVFPNEPKPEFLHDFQEITGSKHAVISTQADLFIRLRITHYDMRFELVKQINEILLGTAKEVDEVKGFRYFDKRDILGFVDGTENLEGEEAEAAVAITDSPVEISLVTLNLLTRNLILMYS